MVKKAAAEADAGVAAYSKFWSTITKAERHALADLHNEMKDRAEAADKARTVDTEEPTDIIEELAP